MVSPSSPGPDANLLRPWHRLLALARVAVALVLLVWSVLLIAWLVLQWAILPHIDAWRPQIERHVGQALGIEMRIGEIRVQSSGWVPALELRDLRLFDREGREALHLGRVSTALAPQSLLALRLRFDQVLIDGATLDLRRDASGRLHVAGLDWGGSDDADGTRLRDWFFEQHEFVIRDAQVRWTDEQRGSPALLLTQVALVVRNGLRGHALRLDATPPPAWGERFSLRGRFTQPLLARSGDLQRWNGTLYAELPHADVAELRHHLSLPFDLSEGDGALRAWVEVTQGVPRQASLDLALRAVSMRLDKKLDALVFEQVQGRFEAERDAEGVNLRTQGLGFITGDGLRWPGGPLKLAWRQKQDLHDLQLSGQPVTGGEFSAERLDLDMMARTAARLPLGEAVRKLLRAVAPQGIVESISGHWDGALDAPLAYQVDARLSALGLEGAAVPAAPGTQPSPGRPGMRNAQLELSANERGGDARLQLKPGVLVFPGVWQEPAMAIDELDATLAWQIVPEAGRLPKIEVKLKRARFANADMQGELEATWNTGGGEGVGPGGRYPGRLDFSGNLLRGRAASVARYLPLGIPQAARDYVRRSVLGGTVASARFKVKGDLWEFPFYKSRDGEFRITARAQDVDYAYLPSKPGGAVQAAAESPWPGFGQVSGEIEFDRLAMSFRDVQARLWGYALRDVHGGIKDLSDARPVLSVEGQGQGPAADLLRYLHSTPLGGWIGPAIDPVSATGTSALQLALSIPLHQASQSGVRGHVQLNGNDLRIRPDAPPLLGVKGRVDFTQQSFSIQSASVRVLGGEATIEGGTSPDGALRFSMQGVASAEALRTVPGFAALSHAASLMRGQAAYRASLGIVKGWPEFTLSSNLVGLQLDLPPPLSKAAGTSWPLLYQSTLAADSLGAGGRPSDSLRVELGDMLKAQYTRDLSGTQAKVVRGAIALFDSLPAQAAGVQANLNLGRVNVDAWQALFTGSRADAIGDAGAQAYLPQALNLRADELRAGTRRLTNLVATLQRQDGPSDTLWRAKVGADQLSGAIDYRHAHDAALPGRLSARLARLSLPPTDVASVEELLSQPPASMPALDIVVDDFELRGKKLGRLEVEAVNRALPGRAGAREWQLDKLNLITPEARLSATGQWSALGTRRMALNFKLDLADSGAFAERLGAGKVLRGGKGLVQGRLSWAGSPLTLDYPSLEGKLNLALESGQILQVDPGSARLLGVFSLQALPRRLMLDFRDVFQEGFAFDNVGGDMLVEKGVATTNNLRIRGVQAIVLMDGSADLLRETQDLQVLVVPNLDAGGAALAYVVIHPAIGLGTLLAQWVLREPLMLAGTREFHVTGPWGAPNVQRIERTPNSPMPVLEPPVPAGKPAGGADPQPKREGSG
jgi:uncharacterized protein (TIGR02099 family)